MILDHSARQVWDTCKRKYYWTYVRHLDAGRTDPMEEGRAIHEGLYTLYKTGSLDQALASVVVERPEGMLPQEEQHYVDMEIAMRETLRGYVQEFMPKEEFEVLAVEVPLAMQLAEDYHYVGIADALIKVQPIGVLVHEYKRSKQIAADWVARFQIDAQSTGYVQLARANNIDARGAVISILRATKYPEYVRDTVLTPEWLLAEWEAEIRNLVAEISYRLKEASNGDYQQWFPKNTNACFQYNTACPFRKLCTESPQVREQAIKEGFFKQRKDREGDILRRALNANVR